MNKIASLKDRTKLHQKLVARAIHACGGNQSELARRMGHGTIQCQIFQWKRGVKLVSPQFALFMEQAVTPNVVRREEFWPELFEGMERVKAVADIPKPKGRPVKPLRNRTAA